MKNKTGKIVAISLAGLVIVGAIGFAIVDSVSSSSEVEDLGRETRRYENALKQARDEARKALRARLQKETAALRAEEDPEETKRRDMVKKLRKQAVRRFFGSLGKGGKTFSAAYVSNSAMPQEAPSEQDQEIMELADAAACEDDLDTAADVAEAALASADPRARIAAVDMLTNLGEAGLLDISEFLTDPHPNVANLAADRWELGIQNIMDERERTALVKVGLLAITDEDQLRSMVGTLQLATDEALIIHTVVDVMREGRSEQREAVKEAYEFTTGEPWQGEEAAAKWLEENYTPPEAEEGGNGPEEDVDDAEEAGDGADGSVADESAV